MSSNQLKTLLQRWSGHGALFAAAGINLNWLADKVAPYAGDWVKQEAFLGISWIHLILSLAILAVAILIGSILGWVLRCRVRRISKNESQKPEAEKATQNLSWEKLTVLALIPPLRAFVWVFGIYGAVWFLLPLPDANGELSPWQNVLNWFFRLGAVATGFWFLYRMVDVVEAQLKHWTSKTARKWDDVLVALLVRALRLVVPVIGVMMVLPTLDIPAAYKTTFGHATSVLLIGVIGYIFYELAEAAEDAVVEQYRTDVKDNLSTRKVQTQVRVLKRVAVAGIVVFTVASMLMVFDSVRHLGQSFMASAGIAGIVVGFAAQRTLSTIVAGIQIAFSQPIRWDDVVIIEEEWGKIEEIALTYVVVVTWDLRRLIVPINYFIEKSFQNWTRVSANLIGSVVLYADYRLPVQPMREELDRILANSPLWDKKTKVLQVTEAKEQTLELRVLVSAANADNAWDLRCEVREKLVDFLQRNYPECLPHARAEIQITRHERSHHDGNGAREGNELRSRMITPAQSDFRHS